MQGAPCIDDTAVERRKTVIRPKNAVRLTKAVSRFAPLRTPRRWRGVRKLRMSSRAENLGQQLVEGMPSRGLPSLGADQISNPEQGDENDDGQTLPKALPKHEPVLRLPLRLF